MKDPEHLPPPPDWGKDELTAYLEGAQRNRYASFVRKRDEFDKLLAIDTLVLEFLKDWENPKPFLELQLLFRAHSAFRVSCQNALAGQVVETFGSCRLCLEFAAYATLILSRPELGEVWLSRHDDETSLKAVRNAFTVKALREAIASFDQKLARIFGELYETSIDFGAHPNERGFSASALMEEMPGKTKYSQIYMHGDPLTLSLGLKNAARVGMMLAHLASIILPERAIKIEFAKRAPELSEGL